MDRAEAVRQGWKVGAGYIRVSTDELAKADRYGLPRQQEEVAQYASKHQIFIPEDAWYVDVISGTKESRKELTRLRGEASNYECVVAPAVDRLGRTIPAGRKVLAELLSFGLEPHVVSIGKIDPNDRHTLLRFNMEGLLAEYELLTIRDRMTGSRKAAARSGSLAGSMGGYGYRIRWEIPEGGGKRRKVYDVHPGEAQVVREIFEAAAGGRSNSRIACDLHERGVRTPRGGMWRACRVRQIIRSTFYMGVAQLKFSSPPEVFSFPVPAIVSEDLWQRANRTAAQRKPWGKRAEQLPLHGILRCADCGRPMVGVSSHNGRNRERVYLYYRCRLAHATSDRRHTESPCANKSVWPAAKVEAAARQALSLIAQDPETFRPAYQEDEGLPRRLAVARELKRLQADEERYLEDYAARILKPEAYKKLIDRLEDERAKLEGELAVATVPQLDPAAFARAIRSELESEAPLAEVLRSNGAEVFLSHDAKVHVTLAVARGRATVEGLQIRYNTQNLYQKYKLVSAEVGGYRGPLLVRAGP